MNKFVFPSEVVSVLKSLNIQEDKGKWMMKNGDKAKNIGKCDKLRNIIPFKIKYL